jgi:hypothetical protein
MHPVQFRVDPPSGPRDRLTIAFRPILALPHALVVGGPFLGVLGGSYRTGLFGLLALLFALFDWVAIIFTGQPIEALQAHKRGYLAWRARALAYMAFLRDEYPPFAEDGGDYPAAIELPATPAQRNRFGVALRPLLVLPQALATALLLVAWIFAAIASWFEVVVTGRLSPSLWRFGHEVMRYVLRVEAYVLLIHDQYPPFALADAGERAFGSAAEVQA